MMNMGVSNIYFLTSPGDPAWHLQELFGLIATHTAVQVGIVLDEDGEERLGSHGYPVK